MPNSPHSSRPASFTLALALIVAGLAGACSEPAPRPSGTVHDEAARSESSRTSHAGTDAAPAPPEGRAVAVFAGGCFWCMEGPFEAMPGVDAVLSGYTGGAEEHPTYRQVGNHQTSHVEAIHVTYDPERVTYAELLETFWHNIDPTQDDGQFCDRGDQYRSAIFVATPEEREAAEASKRAVAAQLGLNVVTTIRDAATFWIAEDYHQDFYRTNPSHYQRYRRGCGRDAVLRQRWGAAAGH